MRLIKTLSLLTFASAMLWACGGAPDDELAGLEAESNDELVSAALAKTWVEDTGPAPYSVLVLSRYNTYAAETIVYCIMAPCPPLSEAGVFNTYRRSGKRFLRLYSDNGGSSAFEYKLIDGKLNLRRTGQSEWATMRELEAEPCGDSYCGPGLVCCNPLMSICTAPGELCAM